MRHIVPPKVVPPLRRIARWCAVASRCLAPRWLSYQDAEAYVGGVWYQNRADDARLELRRALSGAMRGFYPGYSFCSHCGWPWSLVKPHSIGLPRSRSGFFVVCGECYQHMRARGQRDLFVAYCLRLYREWNERGSNDDEADFLSAVDHAWPASKAETVTRKDGQR